MLSYFLIYDMVFKITLRLLLCVFYGKNCCGGIGRGLFGDLLAVIFSFSSMLSLIFTILNEFILDLAL